MEYILLSEKDWDDVNRLLKDCFLPREPTCVALHFKPESVINLFEMIVEMALKSGTSYGARDTGTGKLAGFMLNRISLLKDQEMEKNYKWEGTPEENLFMEVNENVYKGIDLFVENDVESVFEFMCLTVDPSYKGKGIARKLVELSEAKAIEKGCPLGKVEASNVITQYIWKKLGYQIFTTLDFHVYNQEKGKEVFDLKAVAPTKGWHCMSKRLDGKLQEGKSDGTIEYTLLSEKDWDDVKPLLKDSFVAREPTCLALHIKPEEVMNLFTVMIDMTLKSGTSYGARDKGTGKLVGFMLNKISLIEHQEMEKNFKFDGTSQENLYIQVFLDTYKDIDLFSQTGVERIFDFCCLTVDPSYKGKGIARKLVQVSEAKGIEEGCQLGKVEASNIITQNLWKKLGYEIFMTLDFNEYNKEKGKEVFDPKAAAPTTGWHCMSKRLNGKKHVKEPSGTIEYGLLSEKDWDDVKPLLKDCFLAREPTCLALHIQPEESMEGNLFTMLTDFYLKSGTSYGARDTGSGKLVGFMLNMIETPETQEEEKNFKWDGTPNENLFIEVSKEVFKDIDLFAQNGVDRIFHFNILTVDPSCKGKGIGVKLVELSEAKGIEEGCQLGKVEASNIITQHIWKKLGYEIFTTLDFNKYNQEKGKEVFDLKAAAPTTGWHCMSKRLDGK